MKPPASTRDLVREVRTSLDDAADAAYRESIARLVPGVKARGVKVPVIRALASEFAKSHASIEFETACAMLDESCAGGWREDILFATFVIARQRKLVPSIAWKRVLAWLDAVDNWETCDQLAMTLAAAVVAANPARVDDLVALAKDANPWRRRFALATAAALNQKGRAMPDATLRVCEPLVGDAEPTVRNALGWALREASERDEAMVFAFVKRHRTAMPKSVLREGSEKLTEAHRKTLGL